LFCVAAGYPFNVSCDNLEGDCEPDRIAAIISCGYLTIKFKDPIWNSFI
jgi:elongation factor P hydroxylase